MMFESVEQARASVDPGDVVIAGGKVYRFVEDVDEDTFRADRIVLEDHVEHSPWTAIEDYFHRSVVGDRDLRDLVEEYEDVDDQDDGEDDGEDDADPTVDETEQADQADVETAVDRFDDGEDIQGP